MPGPLGAIVRTAPATLAALFIVGVALGVNGLLGDALNPDGEDSGVYALLQAGSAGDFRHEGNFTRSLRVSLLRVEWGEITADDERYWGAEVKARNVGTGDIFAPTWKLRAGDKEYEPAPSSALGDTVGNGFTLSPGGERTGWVVFKIPLGLSPQWLRARLPGYPDVYFAIPSIYRENVSR